MNLWYSFWIALSMYSKLPAPSLEWTKPRMRYVMCFFPVVGNVCGIFLMLWFRFSLWRGIGAVPAGLVGACIPILVTGGIHMDGFLDTVDARCSYGDRDKKLEILKDPHTGAFAIIGACVYMLLYAGCMVQLFTEGRGEGGRLIKAFCLIFPLERAFSGLSVVWFPCAKDSGLARTFADSAARRVTLAVLLFWIGGAGGLLLAVSLPLGLLALGAGTGVFLYYWWMSKREFGGITGDLAGWFLQSFELAALAVLALGGSAGPQGIF